MLERSWSDRLRSSVVEYDETKDILETLSQEFGPVCDAGCHEAAMDVIEGRRVGPVVFNVVDLEGQVWRNTIFLSAIDDLG